MRYMIRLAYNGTPYCGWQRQTNAPSVQQTLEEALCKVLHVDAVATTGCGRTDTGVHASDYYAHFELDAPIEINQQVIYHLNCCLPDAVAVFSIEPTELHARFDAKSREYQYRIARTKNPFTTDQTWLLTAPLDTEAMQQAARYLLGTQDFSSLARTGSDNKTNICTVAHAEWTFGEEEYVFTIRADRFLRGMVRATVGTLVEVGRGKYPPAEVKAILEARNRAKAGPAAVPEGLFLTEIKY